MSNASVDDVAQLSDGARRALNQELQDGEVVRAVVPGFQGTALVATDRRFASWKDNVFRSWPVSDVQAVIFGKVGLGGRYVALDGPTFDNRKLGLAELARSTHAVLLVGHDARPAVEVMNRALAEKPTSPVSQENGEDRREKIHAVVDSEGAAAPRQPESAFDVTDQLRKLGDLRDLGILTDAEFSAKKAELLSQL